MEIPAEACSTLWASSELEIREGFRYYKSMGVCKTLEALAKG